MARVRNSPNQGPGEGPARNVKAERSAGETLKPKGLQVRLFQPVLD
jgi:hypothetical protein